MGAGYNVNQSKIAIGSGGLAGKGFLNGTQNKLKYVPEQHTDFIFCTIGEEEGFIGASTVLVLYLALILRLIHIAERQRTPFERVYLLRHLDIDIPCRDQRRDGDRTMPCNWYPSPLLQLRRLLVVGLHHTALHPPPPRRLPQRASRLTNSHQSVDCLYIL